MRERSSQCASSLTRVLIVDDDTALSYAVQLALKLEACEVLLAANGEEALHVLSGWSPDLILLDLQMPVMDGRTFAAKYLQTPGTHAPIVIFCASDEPVAGKVPADRILHKSGGPQQVVELVRAYAKGFRAAPHHRGSLFATVAGE